MKRILLISFFCLFTSVNYAQSKEDSIDVTIDTINIRGKVIDERGNPVSGAQILSETNDKDYGFIQSKTDIDGLFSLNGIAPKNRIRVRTKDYAVEQDLKGSRYLLITLSPLSKLNLIPDEQRLDITAKRTSARPKYTYKIKNKIVDYGFHPFGHYSQANYPGGISKFYTFVQKNVVYPEKAILNNIEGVVAIEFTVDKLGNLKDFLVVKDIGYGCSEEVLRVVKTSRKWNSAMNGLPVEQRVSIEIPFKLTD